MKKIYKLSELSDLNYKAYLKVMMILRNEIAQGSSNEAIEKYCDQAGIYADEKGFIFKER